MMTPVYRRNVLSALGMALLPFGSEPAHAADWPSRPIRMIVPYPPGGASDVVARLIMNHIGRVLDTSTVIDNRPGAVTTIGAVLAARADPDGYTLLMASAVTMCILPAIYGAQAPFNVQRDFVPISLVSRAPFFMMVSSSSGITTVDQVLDMARRKPGQVTYGTNGRGSSSHLGMLLLERDAGVKMLHVPYRSIPAASIDLAGGQVNVVLGDLSAVSGLVEAGKIRLIASASTARSPLMPQIPTVKEATGIDLGDISPWFGMFGPAKIPEPIVARLNQETRTFLATKEAQDVYKTSSQLPISSTPDELAALIRQDTDRFAVIIREDKITLD